VRSHSATFVYNYSDFPGNTEKLMATYFDSMLYMSNWGTRQLIFRFPVTLVDKKKLGIYCISEEIDRRPVSDKRHIILKFDFHGEDQAGWLRNVNEITSPTMHHSFRPSLPNLKAQKS